MAKVTIDKETFKALASDVRLEILKALDGRKMNLSEIARKTGLSKTTILEHMNKLIQADLVKKIEREGHKWTYYKLSWKGSSLLHPDNTKIVITFCLSFFFLLAGVAQIIVYGDGFYLDINGSMYGNSMGKVLGNTLPNEGTNNTTVNSRYFAMVISKDDINSIARNHTILKSARNTYYTFIFNESYNYSSIANQPEENQSHMMFGYGGTIRIFFQDPFYLYCGSAFLITSIILLLITFRKLWNRKPAL